MQILSLPTSSHIYRAPFWAYLTAFYFLLEKFILVGSFTGWFSAELYLPTSVSVLLHIHYAFSNCWGLRRCSLLYNFVIQVTYLDFSCGYGVLFIENIIYNPVIAPCNGMLPHNLNWGCRRSVDFTILVITGIIYYLTPSKFCAYEDCV